MKMTSSNLMRVAGLSALLAGICYVFVGIFHPPNLASSVTSARWAIVHVVACAMSFFGVLGLAGIYARQAEKSGRLGLAGFVMLSLWFVLIMAGLSAFPVAIFEFSLGVWLVVKGFNPEAVAVLETKTQIA